MKNNSKEYVIEDIKRKKNGVVILLSDEEILISQDAYVSSYLYPGKVIQEEERQQLLRSKNDKAVQDYISKLLSSHRYTYQTIKEKLQNRYGISDHKVLVLLTPYIENKIIDDHSYCLDYIEAKVQAGYGRSYIQQQLQKKGILKKDYECKEALALYEDTSSITPLIEKLNQSHRNKTIQKRKESIYQSLIRRGFSSSLVQKEIESFYASQKEEEKEADERNRALLLKKEYQKCYNSLSRKSVPEEKKKNLLIQKLLNKGFRYEEILKEITEGDYHD